PRLLGTLGILALLTWAGLTRGRGKPALLLAGVWYALTLLPTANLLVLVGTIFGERLLFLPSVAFSVAAGFAGYWLLRKTPWALVPLAGWATLLTIQTIRYTGAWDNDVALFQAAVAAVPGSTKAQHKLGEELLRAGKLGASLPHLREALRIAPDNEFAVITLGQAREEVARRYLPAGAGSTIPTDVPEDPEILYTLGDLSRQRGDMPGAERYWIRALEENPAHAPALADMGLLTLTRGDTARAERHLQAAVEEEPGLARAWYNLGRIHLARGNVAAARNALTRFVEQARNRFPQQVAWARQILVRLPDS
ncbi:MAG: tetratricopeptide repeat protein, partial [Gemmatimonadota bacterium]